MNSTQRKSVRGPVWRNQRRELRRKRILKLIKCIIVGCVAGYAMATEQAAMWLTWPALCWSISHGAVTAELLLMEDKW